MIKGTQRTQINGLKDKIGRIDSDNAGSQENQNIILVNKAGKGDDADKGKFRNKQWNLDDKIGIRYSYDDERDIEEGG